VEPVRIVLKAEEGNRKVTEGANVINLPYRHA
jgi:hypothetical protein